MISTLFIIVEGISTWAYIPQIMRYWRDANSRNSISIKAWVMWFAGCCVKLIYVFPSHDVPILKFYLAFDVAATLIVSLFGISAMLQENKS